MLARHTLKFPVPHYEGGLAEGYLAAFDKIWTHRHELKEEGSA